MRELIEKAFQHKVEERAWEKSRQEYAEKNRLVQLEEDRRRAEVERRQKEIERRKSLLNEAESWQTSHNLRSYLESVEGGLAGRDLPEESLTQISQWLDWARRVASELDPLQARIQSLASPPNDQTKDG